MNLQSISDRYMVATEAAEAPDYALGAPRRVTAPVAAPVERWVATGTPGYVRSTTTGAIKTQDGPMPVVSKPAPMPPWAGPLIEPDEGGGACCVPSIEEMNDAGKRCLGRGVMVERARSAIRAASGADRLRRVPADKRAAVIAALNALEA